MSAPVPVSTSRPVIGRVRRLSPALDAVIGPDAAIEQLADGYVWSEGPVWVKDGGYLVFSDVPGNVMYRWSEADGATVFLKPSGYDGPDPSPFREPGSNGLALDAAGRLLVCDHGNRALARVDLKTKKKTILVDRYQGKKFNSPNDLAVAKSGAIYFTDPPYGLAGINDSPIKELSVNGVYRYTPDGAVVLIDGGLTFPNGIALSPDQRRLYVSVSDPDRPVIMAYDLGADGLPTGPGKVFFDTKPLQGPNAPGNPDGMALDVDGRLFATGPGGVLILTPRAELIGVIETGHAVANCAFGEDGKTLFLTSDHILARVRTKTTGLIT
ncbi:MAG: gluconolactonase [Caulobacter sp.]|nr:gluconolactonase [Caulobacter sp.]